MRGTGMGGMGMSITRDVEGIIYLSRGNEVPIHSYSTQ